MAARTVEIEGRSEPSEREEDAGLVGDSGCGL